MSCGEVYSQARGLVGQGYTATLVATTLLISRSSLYCRKKPRGSRADRTYDEQIVVVVGRNWPTAIGESTGGYNGRKVSP